MTKEKSYFEISIKHLKGKTLFPFHLYIFNPLNSEYSPFIFANSPLNKEKIKFLKYILERGGKLAVSIDQKETFLENQQIDEKEVPSLKKPEAHELEKKQIANMRAFNNKLKTEKFHIKEELTGAWESDDFSPIIQRTREELACFSPRLSETVSLAIYLSEHHLFEDHFINRVVSLAYQFAKSCHFSAQEALGDLVVGAYFSHLGMSLIDYDIFKTPELNQSQEDHKDFTRHPALSAHLLKKCSLHLSERCIRIISQHHERESGGGYPHQKKGEHIDPLALILGASSHIMEYTSGRITESSVSLQKVVACFRSRSPNEGLEMDFGKTIFENLCYLVDLDHNKEKKQAA